MGLLSRDDEQDRTGTPEQPITDALREQDAPRALPDAPENAWQDHTHESLFLELLDHTGATVGRARWVAPQNANAAQVHQVQAVIAHDDGCSRVLATWDLPPY